MQLAKIRYGTWGETVGIIDGVTIKPLVMNDTFRTLSDLLESRQSGGRGAIAPDVRASDAGQRNALGPDRPAGSVGGRRDLQAQQDARMEESQGAARFYDLVYEAPIGPSCSSRPPLIASPVPGEPVRIRADAKWNVPEPELALVLNSRLKLVGFTVGNDMSSRDIEGENPLYLPQAKVYDGCCALGPGSRWPRACPARGDRHPARGEARANGVRGPNQHRAAEPHI